MTNLTEIYDLPSMENSPLSADKLRYNAQKERMDLRTKAFGTDVEDFEKREDNKFTRNVLFKLRDQIGSLISSIRTALTSLFGNHILFQKVVYSEELSDFISNEFVDTKVNVYSYNSMTVNAFTMPGNNITSSPLIMRIQELITGLQRNQLLAVFIRPISGFFVMGTVFFSFFVQTILLLEQIFNIGINTFKRGNPWKIRYDPISKKMKLNISEVTIYITTSLIKMLDNDDELKAVLLHEVGHNLNHLYSIINRLLAIGLFSGALLLLTKFKELIITYNILIIASLIIGTCFIIFFMNRKHDEEYADEFAIKAGYGKALERGLIKSYKYSTLKDNLGKKGDILERAAIKIGRFNNRIVSN